MQEAVATSPARSPVKQAGRIGVREFTVERKKNAATAQEVNPEMAKAKAEEIMDKKREDSKLVVEQARGALGGHSENARLTLRILSGNDITAITLNSKMEAEFNIAQKISNPKERSAKMIEIQSRYNKLMDYAERRKKEAGENIEKLKKSKKPEDRALGLELEIARNQIEISSYDETVTNLDLALKADSNPTTGRKLTSTERTYFEGLKESYIKKATELKQKNGEKGKSGLIAEREGMTSEDGEAIPSVIDNIAVALTDGSPKAVEIARENPTAFIEKMMAKALSSKEGMDNLTDNLVKAGIVNEVDKDKFKKDMRLGLTTQDKIEIAKSEGGKTVMSLISILGMLGYVAWKKTQEGGGGGQMMG
ncbi:MAG: hypothetical protein WC741_01745 [Patescibacteria group bacterium]|jgi:hypothetical protein